jgi:hypothetical protein
MANSWVTVPGSSNTLVTISPTPGDALLLAQQIGLLLGGSPTFPTPPNNNLSVTTVSGSIPTLGTAEVFLHGPEANYAIANDGGSLYVSDSVLLRDGTQILPSDTQVAFKNGLGVFDPTGAAEDVSRLYEGLLDRAPDIAGLQYWTGLENSSNESLTAVANALIASPEFQNQAPASKSDFVANLYQNALARAPSDAETTYWTNLITSATSFGAVAVGIAESPEAKARSLALSTAGDNNEGEVYRLYKTVFGRSPDAGGMEYWSAALGDGSTIAQVAQAVVGSAEFQGDYGTSDATAFVKALYQNTFNRPPDDAGLQYWVNVLQGGASKANVIVGIADSLESRKDTAAATHANWVFVPSTPLTTELLLSGPGGQQQTVPGGYDYVVVNDLAPDTLTASNAVIATNTVGGTFFVSGTSTLAGTGGNNTVDATGQYDLSFGPGNNVIIAAGSGTVATDRGSSTVSVTGSNDLILPDATTIPGASKTTITAGGNSSGLTVDGTNRTGTLQFVGNANTATIIGSSGGSTVTSGIGGVVFTANGTLPGASDVASLTGASTIFGSTDSNLSVSGGSGDPLAYTAGAGNVTLNAAQASGNVTVDLTASGRADSVTLGTGNNTVIAGGGRETLGGSGNNLYQFTLGTAGNTTYTVSDASLANDTFSFIGYHELPTLSGNTLTVATGTGNLNVVFSSLPGLTDISQIGQIKISSLQPI